MSAPVINTTTSVLGYKQWQAWEYQPYATNSPTSWACPNLPAGLTINTSTGLISGAASVAGVFVCGLTATNGDGTSAPLALTIGIEESAALLTNSGYQVEIDVVTRAITVVGGPGLFARDNDSLLIWAIFKKNGVALDLDMQSMEIAIKEFAPDNRIVLGSDWKKYGSGTGAYYGLHAAISGTAIRAALSGYEKDSGIIFDGIGEIGWVEANPDFEDTPPFGPENFQFSTRDFPITLGADSGTVA